MNRKRVVCGFFVGDPLWQSHGGCSRLAVAGVDESGCRPMDLGSQWSRLKTVGGDMDWKSLALGVVLGVGVCVSVAALRPKSNVPDTETIAFTDREYSISGDPSGTVGGYVHLAGTLSGGDVGPKNNTTTVVCSQDEKRCEMAFVGQIGATQVDDIGITDFEITAWRPDTISAKSENLCSIETINISRTGKHAQFVVVPTNQEKASCEHSDTTIRKMTLERSLFWQRSDPKNSVGF